MSYSGVLMRQQEMVATSADEATAIMATAKDWEKPTVQQVRNCILEGNMVVPGVRNEETGELDEAARFFARLPEGFETAIRSGRLFDMGNIPNTVIKSETHRAGDLFGAGFIGHPFRECYAIFHTWEFGGSLYLVDPMTWAAGTNLITMLPPDSFMVCEAICLNLMHRPTLLLGDMALVAVDAKAKGYNGVVQLGAVARLAIEVNPGYARPHREVIGNLCDPVMSALLLLATDGVPVDRIAAPDKLNRARLKNGKPPIPAHWHVHTGPYVTALTSRGQRRKDAQGGHHSSPIPHLRRGHKRVLNAYHGGQTIWVRDAVVNVKDGKEMPFGMGRSFYQQREAGK
jgi:hypothetical protein